MPHSMTQIPAFKNRKLIVDNTSVGPSNRQTRLNSPDQFHALIREHWDSRNGDRMGDDFRGLAGCYWAIYNGSKGTALTNLSSMGYRGGNAHDHSPTNLGFMREQIQQVYDPIIFDLGVGPIDADAMEIVEVMSWTPANPVRSWVQFRLNIDTWDAGWYDKNDSYFNLTLPNEYYFSSNAKIEGIFTGGSTVTYANDTSVLTTHGVLDRYLLGGPSNIDPYIDRIWEHPFISYSLSTNIDIRNASGAGTTVESGYNYYLTTQPPYEEVINSTSIPEYLLPNQYLLQAEARNTSTQMYAASNYYALDWGGILGAFDVDSIGYLETGDYYQKVALGIEAVAAASGVPSIVPAMEVHNSNFLILNCDMGIVLNEGAGEYLDVQNIPFYNKIVITPDDQEITGKNSHASILRQLREEDSVAGTQLPGFIDLLQEYIAYNILKGNQKGTMGAVVMNTTPHSFESGVGPTDIQNSVANISYPVYANLEPPDFTWAMSSANFLYPATSDAGYLDSAGRIAAFNYPNNGMDPQNPTVSLPYTLLRNYNPEALSAWDAYVNPVIESAEKVEEDFSFYLEEGVRRNYRDIVRNQTSHTETLMYIIEKYPIPETGPFILGNPMQRFFISNYFGDSTDLADKKTITYYDSQVKYQQSYRYVIKKVVLVFGNSYQYRDYSFTPNSTVTYSMVTVGVDNQMSVKAVVVPYAITDSIVADSPPVAPNLSFYPFKGVNNQVLLLLNGGVGLDSQTPIALLDSDEEKFEANYLSQNSGDALSYAEIANSTPPKMIDFTSDDPVMMYQIFRVSEKPTSYGDFIGQKLTEEDIGSTIANGASYIDSILPNIKYYYCARALDIHGNISNPTFVYEIELVDNQAQIFMRLNVFIFEGGQLTFVRSGRRFLYVEPALQQIGLVSSVPGPGPYDVNSPPNTAPILGLEDVEKVWNETFKIRLSSKKSGKKLDLNITFKNSGIVNPNPSD